MAGTIQYALNVTVSNGEYRDLIANGSKSITQTAVGRGGHVQSIGTTEEVVDIGDVATSGYLYLHNLDAANFVEFGPESAGAMVSLGKLLAGEEAWLPVKPSVVLRAKADTAAVLLDVRLYER